MPPQISVIVPARGAERDVRELMHCLDAQTLRDFEILIVDDASDPPLSAAHLRLELRSGSYAARNAGIAASTGRALAFTDADCRPDPSWLQAGLTALSAAPRAAGRIELTAGDPPSYCERLDRARFLRQERYVAEGFGATANLFVRRAVFDAIGPFDARLVSGGDAELGRRATAAGFAIRFAPESVVRHPCRDTPQALLEKAHRVGVGFGQRARLFGLDRGPAGERLRLLRGPDPLLTAGLLALHGATLLGALRGYIRAQHDLRRDSGAG